MITHRLNLQLQHHQYPIYIGEGIYNDGNLIASHLAGHKALIVTNETVAKLYLEPLQQALAHLQVEHLILPDGEQYKTLETWTQILNTLVEQQHHRDSTVITLGGGVIGDMGGFAAASYQRGIGFIQIPTTLLSQVDASIGGKTAVNHLAGKNLIGAFHQPACVIIDIDTLSSLPEREYLSGLAEIVKAALIKDADFFAWLEAHTSQLLARDKKTLTEAIYQSATIKKDIVTIDEKEQNLRALLNLGHTFAHAIEQALNYRTWLHGEAVAAGLVLAAKLSEQQQLITKTEVERIEHLLHTLKLPTKQPDQLTSEQLLQGLKMDKKIKNDQLCFILLKSIGSAFISNSISEQDLKKML